jgi:hypothetical protein
MVRGPGRHFETISQGIPCEKQFARTLRRIIEIQSHPPHYDGLGNLKTSVSEPVCGSEQGSRTPI